MPSAQLTRPSTTMVPSPRPPPPIGSPKPPPPPPPPSPRRSSILLLCSRSSQRIDSLRRPWKVLQPGNSCRATLAYSCGNAFTLRQCLRRALRQFHENCCAAGTSHDDDGSRTRPHGSVEFY